MAYKFIPEEPEDGTLVAGVVYYIGRQAEIHKLSGFEPIGYVIKVETTEFEIGEPEKED